MRHPKTHYLALTTLLIALAWLLTGWFNAQPPLQAEPDPTVRPTQPDTTTAPATPTTHTIMAVGDVMVGGRMEPFIEKQGPDYPFEEIGDLIRSADIAVANLEAPFGTRGTVDTSKTYSFLVPPSYAAGLKNAGFDVLTLANNHMMDFGAIALNSTIETVQESDMLTTGAGTNLTAARQPAIIELDRCTIAFLAYSATLPASFYAAENRAGTAQAREEFVRVDVPAALKKADLVVVSYHWGQELKTEPKDYQRMLGRAAIDSGASLVIGHHPHILQGVERYKDGLIAYSLGNFAFGSYSPNAKTSAVLAVDINKNGLISAELIPINVDNFKVDFQTRIETGPAAAQILNEMITLSTPFETEIKINNDRGHIQF